MIRGLYTAATGMNVQAKKLDYISNDLANVNTTGYKKDEVIVSAFEEVLTTRIRDNQGNMAQNKPIGTMSLGAKIDDVITDFKQGSLIKTDGMTDLAVQGAGFFVVDTPNGEMYTRDGSFSIDAEGVLVTKEGYEVRGTNGPIVFGEDFLTQGGEVSIRENGEILISGEFVNQLEMVRFEDANSLIKAGDNLYTSEGEAMPFDGKVTQGYLESSTVNPVTAMVDMITVSRAYEANQKMIQVHDSLLGKAVNEIAKV